MSMDVMDRSARVAIRNALLRASKRFDIVQGPCGQAARCGDKWSPDGKTVIKHSRGRKCCALCAVLMDDDDLRNEANEPASDPEHLAAYTLSVDRDWIMSFLQGFDGDANANEVAGAYKIGQQLWRLFSDEKADDDAA